VIVCLCRGVSEPDVRRVVVAGARTPKEVAAACGAGTDCGACRLTVAELVQRDTRAAMAEVRA
jgi:bacterioferritin-associated ferredoxin